MNNVYRFLSLKAWGSLSPASQRRISSAYASFYNKKFTRHLIKPYCKVHYQDPNYLDRFVPASGNKEYESFQDFFIRKFKDPLNISSDHVWPCEGYLCDYGTMEEVPFVNVKGDRKKVNIIFGEAGPKIPKSYFFSNVFLHNNNYHRIHSPVNGTIDRIERINGELVILRPWIYKNDPSLPAFRNERVNVDIVDEQNNKWFISIVGGPAVGTIILNEQTTIGSRISAGQEIGTFLLGSTCCIASPVPSKSTKGSLVFVGMEY